MAPRPAPYSAAPARPARLRAGHLRSALLAPLLLLAVLTAVSRAQDADAELAARLARLEANLESARQELHIPGLAIAVVQDDRVVLARGFGLADVAAQTPATAETLFAIGSCTKAFTATLCAMLVDEGRLAWDDPITKSLPYFTLALRAPEGGSAPAAASLRDLLSHRTGFSRNDVLWAGGGASRDLILRTAALAEPWAAYREEFLYNNVQVMAAGMSAALAAGTDWDALVKARLLDPLAMASSSTSIRQCADDPRLALGYMWDDDTRDWRHLPMRNLDGIAPAGSINSNVLDMAQWVRLQLGHGALDGKRLVGEAALAEMWTPQMKVGGGTQYGLCWFLSDWNGHRVVEHGGNIDGFAAEVALLPDDGLGFVLLTNVSATPLQATARALVWEALLGAEPANAMTAAAGAGAAAASADLAAANADAAGSASAADASASAGAAASARAESSGAESSTGAATAASAAAPLEDYVGAYTANSPGFRDVDLHVLVRDGHLALDVPGQTVYALKPPDATGRWFFALTDAISVSFTRDAAGRILSLTMEQAGGAFEAPRVGVERAPEEPLDGLRRYLGQYEMPGMRLTATIHNGRLALDVPGQMIYELHLPDADGSRRFRAVPGFSVRFVEADGAIASLVLTQPDGDHAAKRVPGSGPDEGGAQAALPTVDEILALRGATATDAPWLALGGAHLTGTIRFANAGLSGRVAWTFAGLDRFRQDVDLGDFGFGREASDGTAAWSESTFEPWQELRGDALAQALESHPSALFGNWHRLFDDIRVLRRDTLDGRAVLVVALRRGSLPPTTLTLDAATGEPLQAESIALNPGMGGLPQLTTFSDWRDVSGVRLPFRVSTRSEATGRVDVVFDSVETGHETGDAVFRLVEPAATPGAASGGQR